MSSARGAAARRLSVLAARSVHRREARCRRHAGQMCRSSLLSADLAASGHHPVRPVESSGHLFKEALSSADRNRETTSPPHSDKVSASVLNAVKST